MKLDQKCYQRAAAKLMYYSYIENAVTLYWQIVCSFNNLGRNDWEGGTGYSFSDDQAVCTLETVSFSGVTDQV